MSDKKELQDQELQAVNGGVFIIDGEYITCKNCGKSFENTATCNTKTIGSGCNKETIYQCPNCKKWIYYNGDVYDD